MPFIGQDWRAPGDAWVRTHEGWELVKLRPLQFCPNGVVEFCQAADTKDPLSCLLSCTPPTESMTWIHSSLCSRGSTVSMQSDGSQSSPPDAEQVLSSKSVVDDYEETLLNHIIEPQTEPNVEDAAETDEEEQWLPHCFVKKGKSKEFVGCTSMSEAFHKLNLTREVKDVQRFTYICKVVQILVQKKLKDLSGSARKILLSIVEAIVMHSLESDKETKTARQLVRDFVHGLDDGSRQHCGSPTLLARHLDSVGTLDQLLAATQPTTPTEANCAESGITFVDLPKECLRAVLRRLPDHVSLLEASRAHDAFAAIVEHERKLWHGLCRFHFTQDHIDSTLRRLDIGTGDDTKCDWRHVYFESKKFFGLREVYADMLHICCHCKALFWKALGHPCLSPDAPSVRVTPQQFVDMLMLL